MRKLAAIASGLVIGIAAGAGSAAVLSAIVQASDPAYQCAKTYLATKEFRITDKPVPERLAQVLAQQCQEEIRALSAIELPRSVPGEMPGMRA
jgi:hypothetical protein